MALCIAPGIQQVSRLGRGCVRALCQSGLQGGDDHIGGHPVSEPAGMGAPVILPAVAALLRGGGDLRSHVDRDHLVAGGHGLMSGDGDRHFTLLQFVQHPGINVLDHHDPAVRVISLGLPDDAFHSPDAFAPGVSGILVVIDRELDHEEIDLSLTGDVWPEAAGPAG